MNRLYLDILKKYWGYDSFRGIQEQIIDSIGQGRDTLGLMPTGGGKSVAFQVPALSRQGLCLVITPLIALMKDQVAHLRAKGIKAAAVYSGMTRNEVIITLENCIYGDYKFLYISPERLASDLFRTKLKSMDVSMIAVDEAHCISQWGYDFRPSYLKIAEVRRLLPGVPVLALTATATDDVIADIQDKLLFASPNVVKMSFYRDNLAYVVRRTDDKEGELVAILGKVAGSAIVYVRSRKKCKLVSDLLNAQGITADYYHAGLTDKAKDEKQQRWMTDEVRVMVATNAFGMGIDKSDVRLVIHVDVPDSIEAYFQEAGRAGRDGRKAYAVLLFAESSDKRIMRRRVADAYPDIDYIRRVYEELSYYFQIGIGSGKGAVLAFDLFDFAQKFDHSASLADSALKLLALAGYIDYTEEQDVPPRIMLLTGHDEIDNALAGNRTALEVVETVMRNYTGLYKDFAYIDESLVAYKCNMAQRDVHEALKMLGRMGLVRYIPGRKTQYVIYNTARLDACHIRLADEIYKDKRERFKKRTDAIIDYCMDTHTCRSRMLLAYFGERSSRNCMLCDVCLQRTQTPLRYGDLSDMVECLLRYLGEHGDVTIDDLARHFAGDKDKYAIALQYMSDEGMVTLDGWIVKKAGSDSHDAATARL